MVIPYLGNNAFPLYCWSTYVAVNNITNTQGLYMKTHKGVLSIVMLHMSPSTIQQILKVFTWKRIRAFSVLLCYISRCLQATHLGRLHVKFPTFYFSSCLRLTNPQCTYCTYHVTLHSPKRFGARRRHIQGASHSTVWFSAQQFAVNTCPNVLVKRGLLTYALFSGFNVGHCNE
jgi:hypothetical protein